MTIIKFFFSETASLNKPGTPYETTQHNEILENSPLLFKQQTSLIITQDISNIREETEETDLFEETASTPSLSSEDNKVHLKKASTLEKQAFCPIPLLSNLNKLKVDVNRINELDRYQNMPVGKAFVNHMIKPQTDNLKRSYFKDKDPVPGPSNSNSSHKKRKRSKKATSYNSDENTALDDVISITNCLVHNMLNKLDVDEEINRTDDVIEFNIIPEDVVTDNTEIRDSDKEGS